MQSRSSAALIAHSINNSQDSNSTQNALSDEGFVALFKASMGLTGLFVAATVLMLEMSMMLGKNLFATNEYGIPYFLLAVATGVALLSVASNCRNDPLCGVVELFLTAFKKLSTLGGGQEQAEARPFNPHPIMGSYSGLRMHSLPAISGEDLESPAQPDRTIMQARMQFS